MNNDISGYPYELDSLWRELDSIYHSAAIRGGISDSALDILCAIGDLGEGCQQKDVCNVAYINKQTVNSAVKKLVADGILRLEQGSKHAMHLYLTDAGHATMKRCVDPVTQAENLALIDIGPEKLETAVRIGRAYAQALRMHMDEAFSDASVKPAGR